MQGWCQYAGCAAAGRRTRYNGASVGTKTIRQIEAATAGRGSGTLAKLGAAAVLLALLASCDTLFPPRDTRVRLDVYADRFVYRDKTYRSASALAIGLKAARQPPEAIEVHDCAALEQLQQVLGVVRAEGRLQAEVILPEQC
jgi:hypothetical protein